MFKVLAGERKRRIISPTTIAASVTAHLLLLGGVVYAAGGESHDTGVVPMDTTILWTADDPPPPPDPVEPSPPPAQPDQAPPTPGETLQLTAPDEVPDDITPEAPEVRPVDTTAYSGIGRIGDVIGPRTTEEPAQPTGNPDPPRGGDHVPSAEDVEELPDMDRGALSRALERNYPAVLRDSRVNGRVLIELIVDEDGRVREGSARVVEASHPAFGEATLRAVERFRFRPAKMAGMPVPVRVTIPIQWTVPR